MARTKQTAYKNGKRPPVYNPSPPPSDDESYRPKSKMTDTQTMRLARMYKEGRKETPKRLKKTGDACGDGKYYVHRHWVEGYQVDGHWVRGYCRRARGRGRGKK